ncbi:MAG: YaiO family outer membrane beta-barrel protein [Bacteroidota bacterium]
MYRQFAIILYTLLLHVPLRSQETTQSYKTPEEGFTLMRQFAAEQKYDSAKRIGYELLEENPDNHDVSLYLARLYGWESNYDSAYSILDGVLQQDSTLIEAYVIRVDLAYWKNDWEKLELYAGDALEKDPGLTEVEEKLLLARQQGKRSLEKPELLVAYYYDHFSVPYVRNWHMVTAGGVIPTGIAIFSPYVNAGYHPGLEGQSTDIQFNLDAYFKLGTRNSFLAGYGFSPSGSHDFLPGHRAALEYWRVLPKGFGASAGLRYFYWDDHFTFLTLSGEKYAGNYWISLRSYLFSKDYGISTSWYLTARRYFDSKHNYIHATVGYGTAPDEPLLVVSDLDRLNALSLKLGFSRQLNSRLRLQVMAGYAYEEFDDQEYRNRFDFRTSFFIKLTR